MEDDEEEQHRQNCLLLDPLLVRQGDEYRRCYANILYRWQLLEKRAEVVKLQSTPSKDHTKIGESEGRESTTLSDVRHITLSLPSPLPPLYFLYLLSSPLVSVH